MAKIEGGFTVEVAFAVPDSHVDMNSCSRVRLQTTMGKAAMAQRKTRSGWNFRLIYQ